MATTAAIPRPPKPTPFLLRHPWDRNAILVLIGLIWAGVLIGFGGDIADRYQRGAATYPAIIYIHGTAFVGWLLLLTTQALLIRNRKVRLHRKIGVGGAFLAAAMVVLGLTAALTIQRLRLGTPDADPAFLAIQMLDMAGFGALAAAAISARNQPAAHKRLILLATLSIADAGFARFLGFPIRQMLRGDGAWQFWIEAYAATTVLILGMGAYDWITRRRLHPAYVFGAFWIFTEQVTAAWLYFNPGWKVLATSIIQRWPWA